MKALACALLAGACAGAWAPPLGAQRDTPQDCHGVLTASLASGRMHPHFRACVGGLAPEFAGAVAGSATRTDSVYLGALIQYAHIIRDPRIFEAALALAVRPDAAPAARVAGLVLAATQVDPRMEFRGDGVGALFSVPMNEDCRQVEFSHLEPPLLPTPDMLRPVDNGVPPDAGPRLREIAEMLRGDASEGLLLRRAASCVALAAGDAPNRPVSADAISTAYDCKEDEITVQNRSSQPIEIGWRVEGTSEAGFLIIPAGGSGTFWTDAAGPVLLLSGTEVIVRLDAPRRACSA
jgi:hypothetical protein